MRLFRVLGTVKSAHPLSKSWLRPCEQWKAAGILTESVGKLVEEATELLKDGIELVTDADKALSDLLSYPLYSTLASPEGKQVLDDKLSEVADYLISSYDNGELVQALEEGHDGWKKWTKSFSKSQKRKGKSLFMPLRVLLTGKLHGPDMGSSILFIYKAGKSGVVAPQAGFVTMGDRIDMSTVLASVADSSQEQFQKYYDFVLPYLKAIPMNTTNKSNHMLRAKSME